MKTMEVVVYEKLVFMGSLFRARKIGVWCLVWSFFTLLSINVGVLGGSLRKDVEGLMEFRKAITRDPRGVLHEWDNGNSNKLNPCHWYGVSCLEWRVTRIDLSYSQLTGSLTMEGFLSLMDMLDVLVLKGNNFTFNGFLNTTTSYCSISALDISDNNLGGGIDLGFVGSCQKLVSLNLSYNSLISIGVSKVSYGLLSLDVSHNLLSGDGCMSGIIGNNNCKSLQYLDLSHNKINGTIPGGLSKCDQLVSLNLSANLLVGGIPRDLINCNSSPQHNCSSQLKILDLSNNAFSGPLSSIFESCPPNLELLNLSSNSLSGRIPSSLGDCRELKLLNLSTNKLTGPIPPSMGGLESIEQLIMSKNNLTGVIPAELGKTCVNLKKLDLSQNLNLQGSIPLSFSMCSSLHTLDLSKNQLVGTFPKELVSNLKSLKVLQLSYNNMTGTLPISLSNCTNLEVLDLSSNKISGTFPPELCSPSSSLQRLLLADNRLIGPLPPEISKCKNLRSLDLSFNGLSGTIPAVFGSMPNLRDLVIWLNDLEGEIPPEICDNGVLETLILNNNFLTGNVPEALAKCKSLVWLSLSNNRLTGPIPASLGTLDKLAILQLGNNTLTGPIPSELGNCSGLIWLDLNSNLLNGSIPATLSKQSGHVMPGAVSGKSFAFVRNEGGISCKGAGGLLEFAGIRPEELASSRMLRSCASTRVYLGTTVYRFKENGTLMYLDLSYNFLSGEIPDSLGTMMFMEVFNVAHNQLSGIIPSSLGGMKEVGIMDLSYNNFHGFIPGTLGALSLLSDLDVSNNNLTGPIPSSGQLMTFPTSRYANNSGLCGWPLPACGSQANGGGESDHQVSAHRDRALAGSIALGIFIAMVCIVGLTYIAVRTRKEKKQEEMRDKYMDSLPTSGSGSWKLSGVLEPLSINVATFEKPLRKLTFAHLLEATNGFSADSLIGSGGFGDVYKAKLKDGSVVAIKKLIQVSGQGDREFTAEMETIGKIKHRNLVPLLGYCKVGDERLLVYEYMKWGSLENVLHDKGGANLDWTARKKIAIGSARGLAFLHHSCIPHIIHRDMKSSNVLLDENLEPRVSDFGMARLMNALDTHLSVSSLAGTPGYVPPEYYQSFRCTTKGDVYSYGVILLELLSGRRPIDPDAFGDNNLVGWMKQLVKVKKTAEAFDPVLLRDKSLETDLYHHLRIACECLDDRPWRRPTMIQVMAMFRELQNDGEAELDEFALPEDVSVHEEKLT